MPPRVRASVPTSHLLAFGALLNEPGAAAALTASGGPPPCGAPGSLLGEPDTSGWASTGWEPIIQETSPALGLAYWAWRRPLRRGLYVYRTHAVLDGASPAALRAFQGDDRSRFGWDDTCAATWRLPIQTDASSTTTSTTSPDPLCPETGTAVYRCRWPRPLRHRLYVYSRRAWHRPADGGAYSIAVGTHHPASPSPDGPEGGVVIGDYVCCLLFRAARPVVGGGGGGSTILGAEPTPPTAAEVISIYFEDPSARPGFVNLAVRKGLWPSVQRFAAAFRAASPHCRLPRPPPRALGMPPFSHHAADFDGAYDGEDGACGAEWAALADALARGGVPMSGGRNGALVVWRRRCVVALATVVAIFV